MPKQESIGARSRYSLDALGADLQQHELNISEDESNVDISSPEDPVQEVAVNTSQAQKLAKLSVDFLAALALVAVYKFEFPAMYQLAWKLLVENTSVERTFVQLAFGLPRGFAKTTLIKIYVLYCILFTRKKFILIICASEQLAQNFLSDVIDMLNEQNIKTMFGDWRLGIEKDTQSIKKFGYRGRNIILAAIGAGTSLRGLNMKNERPDVMIFDDIQSRECADSRVQSETLETWMYGTAMKAKSPFGCIFIFLANMYPTEYSILKKLKKNPNWVKFIVGGILSDFTSLWEELQPIEQLKKEFENDLRAGHPEIFFAEVLNDEEAQANQLVDLSLIQDCPVRDGDIAVASFIIIDPASGKEHRDAVSIGYCELHDTIPILMEIREGNFSPGDIIRNALEIALTRRCPLIVVEGDAYQESLLYWFEFACTQKQITGIHFQPVYSAGVPKVTRIVNALKAYARNELNVHPECRAAVHTQITSYKPLKRDNVDGLLDILGYMHKVLELYSHLIVINNPIQQQEWDYEANKIYDVIENSSF